MVKMYLNFYFRILLLFTLSSATFTDPWLSGKDEFEVKKLEYFSIKNKFSIDSSAYPIPLALVRNPNEEMFNNLSLMTEYIEVADTIIERNSKKFINEIGFTSNSEFNPFRFIDSRSKDKSSAYFSSSYLGERFATKITISAIENPYDDKKFDFSDSYLALVSGNFILGIGNFDRWWGPSHHASLILSNYSKSSPGVFIRSLEGFTSPLPIISSFGKLNFSFFANQLESNRFIKNPFLIGGRLSLNPVNGLTIGLTRSIMFGGEGKDNSLKALWDSIRGDASYMKGKSDVNIDNELAGFDLKYSFSIKELVWSIYGQYIGEDGTDYWPWRTFYSLGTEWIFTNKNMFRSISLEYYDTFYYGVDTGDDLIYEHSRYKSGYRYRGDPIGAFIDGDSEYINLSIQSEINERNLLKFSLIYGNFSKEQGPKTYVANSINTWKGNSQDFFGLMISLNFKIKKKILLSLNLSSLNEDFIYRGKRLNKEVLGINLNYRF